MTRIESLTTDRIMEIFAEKASSTWLPSTSYKAGQLVVNEGVLYQTKVDFTSTASFVLDNFDVVSLGNALSSSQLSFRNKIINGDFRINQRSYAFNTSLNDGLYCFDRWKSTTNGSSMTFTSVPAGQPVTIGSGGSFSQIIERANITAGTYTLSWSGTATGRVYNIGAVMPTFAASPIVVSVDGLSNLTIEFRALNSNQTLNLVQLEPGSAVTPFEHRPLSIELAMCQRYFIRRGGVADEYANIGVGVASSTTRIRVSIATPPMYTKPTLTLIGTSAAGAWPITSVSTIYGNGKDGLFVEFICTGAVVNVANVVYVNPGIYNYLDISAEL